MRRYTGSGPIPTIRLVGGDGIDLPKHAWPNSWDGLVAHVWRGGFFRRAAVLRRGMDPDEAQRLLASTTLDETLPWPEIDRLLANLRSWVPITPPEMQTHSGRLAQALAGCFALQQYEPLAAFLASLPIEVTSRNVMTPARLATTVVEAVKSRPAQADLQEWVKAATYVEIRIHLLSASIFGLDPQQTNDLRAKLEDALVSRIYVLFPFIKDHTHHRMQDMRADARAHSTFKGMHANTQFSATMVLPNGQWVKDLAELLTGDELLVGQH
jgi:hypothetical protein